MQGSTAHEFATWLDGSASGALIDAGGAELRRGITIVITSIDSAWRSRENPMHTLKLTQIGNSVGVVLPREMLSRLKLEKGQTVFVTETPDGYALTPYDPAIEEEVRMGIEFMREYRDTFHALAK